MLNNHVLILGTRGIPANHGGFETFAAELVPYLIEKNYRVTVYCQTHDKSQHSVWDSWNGIERVYFCPLLFGHVISGAAGTILFDFYCFLHALKNYRKSVWLTLGFNTSFLNIIPKIFGIKQIINMDGLEWQRRKWSAFHRFYLLIAYYIAGWTGNCLIADHPEIEIVLKKHFSHDKISMIAYGSAVIQSADQMILSHYNLIQDDYFLIIARPEKENNLWEIVTAWSDKKRISKLVILGNYHTSNPYHKAILEQASDSVLFLGAIYDKEIVDTLRFYCKAYIHGHSVGGTNPSLVEALGAGNAVIAHDNVFNRYVADNAALYFKTIDDLTLLFNDPNIPFQTMRHSAKQRHQHHYQWQPILNAYEMLIRKCF